MNVWRLLLVALLLGACHEGAPAPSAGSNSNWLTRCERDADCGAATTCECGGCTRVCNVEADCNALPEARCVANAELAVRSLCRAQASDANLCLPRCEVGTCGSERACVLGACVLSSLPSAEFCATLPLPAESHE